MEVMIIERGKKENINSPKFDPDTLVLGPILILLLAKSPRLCKHGFKETVDDNLLFTAKKLPEKFAHVLQLMFHVDSIINKKCLKQPQMETFKILNSLMQ